MVDTTGWTVRNKANPYFAKVYHVRLAKTQATKPLIDAVFGVNLAGFAEIVNDVFGVTPAEFAEWFLASGSWDNTGRWSDGITWDFGPFPWTFEWFLALGRINVFGQWSDSEAW
jgi:hypothetical protein